MRLSKAIIEIEKKKRRRRRKYTGPSLIDTMREIMREVNFELAENRALREERQVSLMGGFTNLKTTFDNLLPIIAKETKAPKPNFEEVARYLELRALFEIAGNLDSIALSQRALVEQAEKSRLQQKEMFEGMKAQFDETLKRLNNPPIVLNRVDLDAPFFPEKQE